MHDGGGGREIGVGPSITERSARFHEVIGPPVGLEGCPSRARNTRSEEQLAELSAAKIG